MMLVIMVRMHHYAYRPCDYCAKKAVVRCSAVATKWICLECLNQQPYFQHVAQQARLAVGEEYFEATRQLIRRGETPTPIEDVPLERMIAPADMEWWSTLA